jgi:hypothetical protein
MKLATSLFLAALLVTSALGAVNNAAADDGILLKQEVTPGSYCHQKFQAMIPSTLNSDQPELKDSTSADVVDFYGSCDETALGNDQVQAQRLENRRPWARDYND